MQEDASRWTSQILDRKLHDFLVKENKAVSAKSTKKAAETKKEEAKAE